MYYNNREAVKFDTGTDRYLTPFVLSSLFEAIVNFLFLYLSLRYTTSAMSMFATILAHSFPGNSVV